MKLKLPWQDIVSWISIVAVTVGAFWVNYALKPSVAINTVVWIAWVLLVMLFAFFTQKGKALLAFATEAKQELEKVIWPTRQETIQTTSIVVVMVTLTGFVLWGIDSGMLWVIGKITHLG